MGKKDYTKIFKVGDSRVVRIPWRIIKDDEYPFDKEMNKDSPEEPLMEIVKHEGKKGLLITKEE